MKSSAGLLGVVLIGLIVCNPAQGSTRTNSLILLDQQSGIDFTDSAIELANYYAGEIYHVFRSKALMGYVPPDDAAHVIREAGVLNVYRNQTQPDGADPTVSCAIEAFNNLPQPVKELTEGEIREKGLEQRKG